MRHFVIGGELFVFQPVRLVGVLAEAAVAVGLRSKPRS